MRFSIAFTEKPGRWACALPPRCACQGSRPLSSAGRAWAGADCHGVACCDARVDVSAIFDAEAGALFIMRNVANLVPPYEPEGKYHGTSAAVEYAVMALKVPHLIVLGHSHCGGVDTYRRGVRDKVPEHGFIGRWLTLLDNLKPIESDIFAYGDEMAFEFAAVRSSIANLGTFPFIQKHVAEGLLALHGLHFDLGSGQLLSLEEETGRFAALAEA